MDSKLDALFAMTETFNKRLDNIEVVKLRAENAKLKAEMEELQAENAKLKKDLSSHYDFSQRVIDACKIREDLESQDDDSIIQGIYNVMRMYAVHCPIWMRE